MVTNSSTSFQGVTKMTVTQTKRSERDDFLMNHTIRKDCERRLKEREETQKHASVYVSNEKSETTKTAPSDGSQYESH